jgi:hypothetical protein
MTSVPAESFSDVPDIDSSATIAPSAATSDDAWSLTPSFVDDYGSGDMDSSVEYASLFLFRR